MDWATYAAARQYVSEHRVGTLIREAERAETAEFHESAKALRESRR